jgi:hypothetical protein
MIRTSKDYDWVEGSLLGNYLYYEVGTGRIIGYLFAFEILIALFHGTILSVHSYNGIVVGSKSVFRIIHGWHGYLIT